MKPQFLIVLILVMFIAFSVTNATADLIAYWSLDDGSGATATDSVGNHDGALEGDPTWEANGKVNGAIAFDGAGDYVQTTLLDELKTGENFSLAAWFKTNVTSVGEPQIIWIGGTPGNGWGTAWPQAHRDRLLPRFSRAHEWRFQSNYAAGLFVRA